MDIKLQFIVFSLLTINTFAQIGFQDHFIDSPMHPYSVYAADLDNDGDVDLMMASTEEGVGWYENTNGLGQFGPKQNFATYSFNALSIFATDIDGDNDNDIITAIGTMAWHENIDGQGNFIEHTIASSAFGVQSVYAIDIDGDGDNDLISGSSGNHHVAWYENLDGFGNFGQQIVISDEVDGMRKVFAIDIDGDSDIDVLSASKYDDKIAWYENMDGQGNFGPQQIISTNADLAWDVHAADLDGDDDIDVLSASSYDNKIAWYENLDGQGTFGVEQILEGNNHNASSVYAEDIDGDGDNDVIFGELVGIRWFENVDGQGTFDTSYQITQEIAGPKSIYVTDIDGDTDLDVVSGSLFVDWWIAWHENLEVLDIDQNKLLHFSLNPNPTSGILQINAEKSITQATIYNEMGQVLLSINNIGSQIDISNLKQGIYLIKLEDTTGSFAFKKLIKN